MSAPTRSSGRRRLPPGSRYGLLLAFAVPMAAYAQSHPVMLDQSFVEPVPSVPASVLAKDATPCAVHIVEVTDGRRSPEMIGMLGGKPVLAPPDRTAWLISVLGALKARGIAADFTNPAVESPGVINAHVTLQTAWINAVQVSLVESVVFKVQAKGPDGKTIDQFYRGSASRMNWASGNTEIKSGINIAFARALDAMARDLAGLCQAKPL